MKKLSRFLLLLMMGAAFVACSSDDPVTTTPEPEPQPQPKPDPDPTPAIFAIEFQDVTPTSCVTAITPDDSDLYYVAYFTEADYYKDSDIDTDEELIADDKYYFVDGAANWGMTSLDYMTEKDVLFQGNQRLKWTSVKPGNEYVIYVYGIEFNEDFTDYEAVTPVIWKTITLPMAERSEVNFAIEVEVDGAFAEWSITPENYNGYYVAEFFTEEDEFYVHFDEQMDDEYADNLAKDWLEYYYLLKNQNGYSDERVLEEAAYTGNVELRAELYSGKSYSLVVYAIELVEGALQMVSNPVYYNFTTDEVQPSNMVLDIEVTNLYVRVCDLAITPTVEGEPVEGEPYLMIATPTDYVVDYFGEDYDDEDIISLMLNDFYGWTFRFDKAITSHMSSLNPNTEYVVAAFGYEGGVVTTPLFKEVFTTEPEGECEVTITDVAWGGPYDVAQVAELDPERYGSYLGYPEGMAYLIWIEVQTNTPTEDIFAYYVGSADFDYFGEETIFYDLLMDPVPAVDVQEGYYYDGYYLCAAAFDYKGNLTPMWKSEELLFKPEDARPAAELIEKLNASPNAKPMLVKASKLRK